MRKFLSIFMLLLALFVIVGCKDVELETPTNVVITEGVVTWDAVEGAESYKVVVNTVAHDTTSTTFDLKTLSLAPGTYQVTIIAENVDKVSLPSSPVNYIVEGVTTLKVLIYTQVLSLMDEAYEPDLDEENFEFSWDYEDYLRASAVADAYSQSAVDLDMTLGDAVDMFTYIKSMGESMGEDASFTDIHTQISGLSDFGMDNEDFAYVLMNIGMALMSVSDEFEYNPSMALIYVLMLQEPEMFLDSLAFVLGYFESIFDGVSPLMMSLLDDLMLEDGLNMEEIFILKDEVATLLLETMPTAQEMSNLYLTLMYVIGAVSDADPAELVDHAEFLGDLSFITMNIYLNLIADVDQQTVEDIMLIVDEMIIPGEWVEGSYYDEWDEQWYNYGYYERDQTDPKKVVELMVYIGLYLHGFIIEQQVLFDDLEALMGGESAEAMFMMIVDVIKAQMEMGMEPEEYAMFEGIFDELIVDLPNILAGLDVLKGIGANLIQEFLENEGAFFIDLIDLVMSGMDMENPELFISQIQNLFGQFVQYNAAIIVELDQPALEKLIRMVRVPISATTMMWGFDAIEDFDLLFESLVVPVSTVFSNFITLEMALLDVIDAMNIQILLFESGWMLSEQEAFLGLAVLVLDELLTVDNEALIFDTLTLILDDIFSIETVLEMTGQTELEISDFYALVVLQLETLFTEIHLISTFDFADLSLEEYEQLVALMTFFGPEEEIILE
ncbi:MAG: fibronectin type III domain-containing protein [Acholeplasmataceae bacterium]|nr:fibronectin type III domain-containing protein [Acholeplasmataceae bacterium]